MTAKEVTDLFKACLFLDGEPTDNAIIARGIINSAGFHPERLAQHRQLIDDLLDQLPEQFREEDGGGWSFLNACVDRNGTQWGEHQNVEQLFLLGMASGRVECLTPRDRWHVYPGGMPYYMIRKKKEEA